MKSLLRSSLLWSLMVLLSWPLGAHGAALSPTVDFLLDKGIEEALLMQEMARSETYMSLYTSSPELVEIAEQFAQLSVEAPQRAYIVEISRGALIDGLLAMTEGEVPSGGVQNVLYARMLGSLAAMLNGRQGANILAASSLLAISQTYAPPEGVRGDFLIWLLYEGEVSVLVTAFSTSEDLIALHTAYVVSGEGDLPALLQSAWADLDAQAVQGQWFSIEMLEGDALREALGGHPAR